MRLLQVPRAGFRVGVLVSEAELSDQEMWEDRGVERERARIVTWLRWMNGANRNPKAKEALDRVLRRGGTTVTDFADAIERGDHLSVALPK